MHGAHRPSFPFLLPRRLQGRNPPRSTPLRLHTPSGEAFLFKHILSSFGRFAIRLLFLCSRSAAACIRLYTSRKAENPAFCIRAKKKTPSPCLPHRLLQGKSASLPPCGKNGRSSAQGMIRHLPAILPSAAESRNNAIFRRIPRESPRYAPHRSRPWQERRS